MALVVTVNLCLPYKIRVEGTVVTPEAERAARLRITEQLVLGAAQQLYPDGLVRKQLRIFQPVAEALTDEQDTVVLDGSQFEFLYELFFSREAEAKVKFAPAAANWLYLWLSHLEQLREPVA